MAASDTSDDGEAQAFWEGLLGDYDDELGSGDELVAAESRLCLSGVWGGGGGGRGEGVQGGGKGGVRTCCFFALSLLRRARGKPGGLDLGLELVSAALVWSWVLGRGFGA